MPRTLDELLADFESLNEKDYDFSLGNYEGQGRVRALCEELELREDQLLAVPIMIWLFERMPDADFGSPGTLVHTLESIPGYESELIGAVRRQPTYYTLWMSNRMLNALIHGNAPLAEREFWLGLLQSAIQHPLIGDAKGVAEEFVTMQLEEWPRTV